MNCQEVVEKRNAIDAEYADAAMKAIELGGKHNLTFDQMAELSIKLGQYYTRPQQEVDNNETEATRPERGRRKELTG